MILRYSTRYNDYFLTRLDCKGNPNEATELALEWKGYRIIEEDAFKNFKNVEKIVIPEGVTSVEGKCFAGLEKLREVIFPETLTYIDTECFANCPKIEEITIPKSIKALGASVFYNCNSLKKITFLGLKNIKERGFRGDTFYNLYDRIKSGKTVIELPDESDKPLLEYTSDMGEYRLPDDFRARLSALPIGKQILLYCLYRPASYDKIDKPYRFCPYGIFEYYHDIEAFIVDGGIVVGFVIRSSDGNGGKVSEKLFPFTKVNYQFDFFPCLTGDNNGAGYKGDDGGGYYSRNYLALLPTTV